MLRELVPLNAVTATTTSSPIRIKHARRIMAQFTRAAHSSGNSVFKISGSIDGTTYVDIPLTALIANAISEGLTRVASVTLSSNTSGFYCIENLFLLFNYLTVTVTETTDGTHTCKLLIDDELVS